MYNAGNSKDSDAQDIGKQTYQTAMSFDDVNIRCR